jgi:hypothetical protein
MMGTVNEDADAGNAVALVIEVRLHEYIMSGPVLRVVGKPETIFVEVGEELPLEAGSRIDSLAQPMIMILLVVRSPVGCLGQIGVRQGL